ncbi:MAG: LptF/LptG family permease [Nitrospirae bacterium]|nr:LptF/LptG family permease [Nitrospirota bacterium]
MTILFRYLLGEFLKVFAACFAGLMTVYLVVDFFEKVRAFIRLDTQFSNILLYFLYKSPTIAMQLAPLAILMATLLTLGMLARNHELTAMRSCGVGPLRIAAPVLHPWILAGNQTLVNIEHVEPEEATLRGVSVYQVGPDFRLTELLESREARYTDEKGWLLQDVTRRTLGSNGTTLTEHFDWWPVPISQKPDEFHAWFSAKTEELTLADMKAHADRLRQDGYGYVRYLTDYYVAASYPLSGLVMVIVGLALGRQMGGRRRAGIALGIGLALGIGFLYWTAQSVSIALGRSGVLVPIAAALLSHALFLSLGGYLFLRVRQ